MVAPPTPAGFQVTARMILELGAELISSDGIALYELIKNAYDAGSKRVLIRVESVFPYSKLRHALSRVEAARNAARLDGTTEADLTGKLIREIRREMDPTADPAAVARFLSAVAQAGSLEDLRSSLQSAYDEHNKLDVIDTGEGMSLEQLRDVFLTIGTRSRLDAGGRQYLGGKGIGRLSTMRLAERLTVRTTRAGETNWNVLEIDWTRFSHESAERLESVPVRPRLGDPKEDPAQHGTRIELRSLRADWSVERVGRLATTELDRLFDPFAGKARYPILIRVNQRSIPIPTFDKRILSEAQAMAEVTYYVDPERGANLNLRIDYLAYNRSQEVHWDENDIQGITSDADVSVTSFRTLGPFKAHLHWFNRQRLAAVDGVGTRDVVRRAVNHWANGLLMYRDGFRVNPYGAPDDDWLGIDVKALGSAGYKVNRKQLIGAVNITGRGNPHLVDQTNREGLRSSEEKSVLVTLLSKAVTETFRNFLNSVEREEKKKARLNAVDTGAFLERASPKTKDLLRTLRSVVPPDQAEGLDFLAATYEEMDDRLRTARDAIATAEDEQKELVALAGIGLLVEIVSHELGRVTRNTLETMSTLDRNALPLDVSRTLDAVESQMTIIRRRLDMLNPLSPSGRNQRESFDLVALTRDIVHSHAYRFGRDGISASVSIIGGAKGPVIVRAVKGMVIQVVENLIDNSIFWLGQRSRADPSFQPRITVEFDPAAAQMLFSDNGPGIAPARAEEVFRPFVSSKPPGEGKGLGLYISKQIATHHGTDLSLSGEQVEGRLHTFVLDLAGLN